MTNENPLTHLTTAQHVYAEALHALRRLRTKALIRGLVFNITPWREEATTATLGCVTGIFCAHLVAPHRCDVLPISAARALWSKAVGTEWRSKAAYEAYAAMLDENESFDGTPEARYTHMVKWLKRKLREAGAP